MVSSKEINEKLKARREGRTLNEKKPAEKIVMKTGKQCPECGKENKEDAKFCVGCGKSFEEKEVENSEDIKEETNTKKCSSCNSEIPENSKFCVVCGETQSDATEEPVSSKNIDEEVVETKVDEIPIKLVIQEIILDEEGLNFDTARVIEGLKDGNELIKYENIDTIELKDEEGLEIIEIETSDSNIKIKGVKPDLSLEFVSYIQKKVEETKPIVDEESMGKIKKAQDLLDIGAIDEEEFENIKKKILEKN